MQNNVTPMFVRPRTPKLKNDWMTIVLKVLLAAGIFFSMLYFGKRNFNSLFMTMIDSSYSSFMGVSLFTYLSTMTPTALIMIKITFPIIATVILFLLYIVFAKFFASLVFRQYMIIGVQFDIRRFRVCLDSSFIIMTVLLGVGEIIFAQLPLAYNFGNIFVPPIVALLSMSVFFFAFSRGLEKRFYPILIHIMIIPTIMLVLFA
ncbi:MAG: hypothetical protein HFE33_01975 [Clostridia bacterium]|jgi:hypothetical protein|nr:hypothetical protein [Clostridia bacterium]MCI8944430.1 hypothetical protein [Clostridia bacterium]MCI9291427.1 hypothetical protein [Clostridia bacterium]MDE6885018.1 hypothetical protein [Clostridia bacterium]